VSEGVARGAGEAGVGSRAVVACGGVGSRVAAGRAEQADRARRRGRLRADVAELQRGRVAGRDVAGLVGDRDEAEGLAERRDGALDRREQDARQLGGGPRARHQSSSTRTITASG
jgi:hypothetical protein